MRILLLRHGQSMGDIDKEAAFRDYGNEAMPLSERGKQQAEAAGTWLKHYLAEHPIAHSHTMRVRFSPYTRTVTTKDLLLEKLGMTPECVEPDHLLQEQNFGSFSTLVDPATAPPLVRSAYQKYWGLRETPYGNLHARPHHGESRADVMQRAEDFTQHIRQDEAANTDLLVLVTHGVTMRAIMSYLTGDPSWVMSPKNPGNGDLFLLDGSTEQGFHVTGQWANPLQTRERPSLAQSPSR